MTRCGDICTRTHKHTECNEKKTNQGVLGGNLEHLMMLLLLWLRLGMATHIVKMRVLVVIRSTGIRPASRLEWGACHKRI